MELTELLLRVNATPVNDTPAASLFDAVNGVDIDPRTEGMTVTFVEPDPVVRREPTETERLHGRYFEWLADRRREREPIVWMARPCGGWGA